MLKRKKTVLFFGLVVVTFLVGFTFPKTANAWQVTTEARSQYDSDVVVYGCYRYAGLMGTLSSSGHTEVVICADKVADTRVRIRYYGKMYNIAYKDSYWVKPINNPRYASLSYFNFYFSDLGADSEIEMYHSYKSKKNGNWYTVKITENELTSLKTNISNGRLQKNYKFYLDRSIQ